jgi:hypothetical protein
MPGMAGPTAAEPAYRTGAYRGGALVVTDPKRAQGHLSPGQVLPIRLSRLVPQGPGLPSLMGTETPGSVRYGQLVFQEVSPSGVTFTVAFRTEGDAFGPARTLTLRPGDSADLTGDGLPDLMLQVPVKALTAGTVAIDYALLAFPCDAAHSAMFALAPEAFAGAKYPYGISGVTPKGHFIFQSDCLPLRPAARSKPGGAAFFFAETATPALTVEPTPGDVMVEAQTGGYGRIEQVHRDPGGLDIHYAAARTPFMFQEVFGAAYIHISGRLPELVRRYRGGAARTLVDLDLVDFDISQNLIDNDSGRLDLQAAAHLGASLTVSANINYYGVSAAVDAEVDESLRLAALYRAGQPWELSFGPWTLASPRVGLPVYGVPIAFCLPVTVGISVDSSYTGSLVEGIQSSGSWGWSAHLAATWGWSGVQVNAPAPVSRNCLVFQGLPENSVRMDGKASIRPWLAITPKLEIAHLLNGGCENTLLVVGSIQGESAAGGSDHAQLDAGYQLKAVCSVDVPLLGKVWERKWPLYDASRTVWSSTWSVKPSAAKAP